MEGHGGKICYKVMNWQNKWSIENIYIIYFKLIVIISLIIIKKGRKVHEQHTVSIIIFISSLVSRLDGADCSSSKSFSILILHFWSLGTGNTSISLMMKSSKLLTFAVLHNDIIFFPKVDLQSFDWVFRKVSMYGLSLSWIFFIEFDKSSHYHNLYVIIGNQMI